MGTPANSQALRQADVDVVAAYLILLQLLQLKIMQCSTQNGYIDGAW